MISRGDLAIAGLFIGALVLGKKAMSDDADKAKKTDDATKPINNAKPAEKKK